MGLSAKKIFAIGVVGYLMILAGCATTKETIQLPKKWSYEINWNNYTVADVTPSEYIVLQNDKDLLIYDGLNGKLVAKDIHKQKGLFAQFGQSIKDQVNSDLLKGKNKVLTKYYYVDLPGSQSILLFDRVNDDGEVRCINLKDGKVNWSTKKFQWNFEKYKDEKNWFIQGVFNSGAFDMAAGMDAVASLSLQTRMVQSMIKEVPSQKSFLFRTVNKLYYIDSKSGKIKWENEALNSSGLAFVRYVAASNQLLVVGNMSGLKDLIKSADVKEGMKQLMLLNADDGSLIWKNTYQGRSQQLNYLTINKGLVSLNFSGGSAELYQLNNGKRILGTRDNALSGTAKFASGISEYNLIETPETAEPIMDKQALYSVNTQNLKTIGLPDKLIYKYDVQTGSVEWKSDVVEKSSDVWDLKLYRDKVIANFIKSGIYAFSKKDGSVIWKKEGPFKNINSHIMYDKNSAWLAGKDSLFNISLVNGKVIKRVSFEKIGVQGNVDIQEIAGNKIIIFGSKHLALLNKQNLNITPVVTPKGQIQNYTFNDNKLVAEFETSFSEHRTIGIINLKKPGLVASYRIEEPENKVLGNLGIQGYYVTNDMLNLIRINKYSMDSISL